MGANPLASSIHQCIAAEEQAIAIYEAECWLLSLTPWTKRRRKTLEVCKTILREEREHQLGLQVYSPRSVALSILNRLAGYALGGILTTLPSRLNWKVHAWAETQAAEVYNQAAHITALTATDRKLLQFLQQAERQERQHSQIFQSLTQ